MLRNVYPSLEEALTLKYGATPEEINKISKAVKEYDIINHWRQNGKILLVNIDLASYFGIPFSDIAKKPQFLNFANKIIFAKCKLAILANPDLENFGIDIGYINSYTCLNDISKTMNAILCGDLPNGYDIFKDISEVSNDLGMSIEDFSVKYRVKSATSFITKQLVTYFPDIFDELMQEFPEFSIQPKQEDLEQVTIETSTTLEEEPKPEVKEDPKKIRRKELKAKIKALYNEPSSYKRGKLTLSTTNLDNFCYSTDKQFHHETKQKNKEKQLELERLEFDDERSF